MVLFEVLALSVCLVAGAPPKDRNYGLGTGGGVGYTDTFRPRFPSVDVRKDTSGGDLFLLKTPHSLEPNHDKPVIIQRPVGVEVEPDAAILHKKEGHDDFPTEKMFNPQHGKPLDGGLIRDIIETPVVEKTIIKKCECEKRNEEKNIGGTVEKMPIDYVPEESHYDSSVVPAKPDLTVYDSKLDPYDIPINPDFGLPPSEEPAPVKPNVKEESHPSEPQPADNPELVPVKPDTGVPQEEATVHVEQTKEASDLHPEYIYGIPQQPDQEAVAPLVPEQPVPDFEVPLVPEQPPQESGGSFIHGKPSGVPIVPEQPSKEPEVPEQTFNEPVLPSQKPGHSIDLPKEPVGVPETPIYQEKELVGPLPGYDKYHPKTSETKPGNPVLLPDAPKKEHVPGIDSSEPGIPVYPQHPADGHKIPVNTVPGGPRPGDAASHSDVPKTGESGIKTPNEHPNFPVDTTNSEVPKIDGSGVETPKEDPKNPIDSPGNPSVDVKPDEIEPKVVLPQNPDATPEKNPIDSPAEVPVQVPVGDPQEIPQEVPVDVPEKPLVPPVSTPSIGTVCEDIGLQKFLYLLNKAGYRDMLTRKRPLTIFVPSDAAWNNLPLAVLNRLHRDRRFLRKVLRYHMVDGLEADQTRNNYYCPSMQQGTGLFLNSYGKNMYVNGVSATSSTIRPANGAIYVLPRVLYPLPANSLADAIQTTGTLTRFYTLALEAGLLNKELSGTGPYTLFAPTDEAFLKLPPKTIEWLSWDKEALRALLLKHLVTGTHFSTFVPKEEDGHLKSLSGDDIEFKPSDTQGEFSVNGAHLCAHDLTTKNGVLHTVDEVLFTQDLHPKAFVRPPLKSVYAG